MICLPCSPSSSVYVMGTDTHAFGLPLYIFVWLAEDCHFGQNAPKHHLWDSHEQNLHIWGVHNAFWGWGVCVPVTKSCILYGSKMPKTTPQKLQIKLKKFALPKILKKVLWGSPMMNICIFWGSNCLPHAATNSAAYKCISLFCNTFLPSGKAVLVLLV